MSTSFFYCVFVTFIFSHCNATPAAHISLPSCKIKNSDVNECLKKYLQEVIKSSKKGNAEHSIPPMDPYFIPKIIIQPYRNDGVLVEMKNSSVYGFSNAIITKIQSDPRKGIFEIHYVTPTTKFSGSYTLTGKLFSIPINGKGLSNVTIHDFHHAVQVQGELRNSSDGNKYLDVKSVNVKLKPQKMRLNFEHLFKENKELGDIVNQMMNDNWQDIFLKLKPKMEEEMSKHLLKFVTDFFKNIPYNEIFSDI